MFLDIFKINKCIHNYKLYNIGTVPCGYSRQYEYRYICTECKKEFSIKYIDIIDIIEECEERFNKLAAIGEIDVSQYKEVVFWIKPVDGCWGNSYKGKYVNWVLEVLNARGVEVAPNSYGDYTLKK
jgi:hypothetical protein